MMPYLNPNDRVVVSSLPYFLTNPKAADVVVFRYNNKILIKRIVKVLDNGVEVRGDNKSDSLNIKSIRKNQILGKVVFKLTTL